MTKVTTETLTDEGCTAAFRAGLIDELTHITANGASGAESEDDDCENRLVVIQRTARDTTETPPRAAYVRKEITVVLNAMEPT